MKKKQRKGRPSKFDEESQPITVTLPKRILAKLETIDSDKAKAIVKCVDSVVKDTWLESNTVDVVQFSNETALLIMPPCKSLKQIPWLILIEIVPSRILLAIPSGTATESLELAVVDLLDNLPEEEHSERALLIDLRQKLTQSRQTKGLSKGEILFLTADRDSVF